MILLIFSQKKIILKMMVVFPPHKTITKQKKLLRILLLDTFTQ